MFSGEVMNYKFDAVILGGGASGLMCAIAKKNKNQHLKIAVLEKNDRVGKKLLATGNGRCNLTNENVCRERYTGSFTKQSEAVFKRYGCAELLDYFESLGLLTFKDSDGRYYPVSRQASTVLDVLRFNCENRGVEFFCKETVQSIKKQSGFLIKTDKNVFSAKKLVAATGSKAGPKLGGSGSAADILKNRGHKIVPFTPALCPIEVKSDILKSLKGLRAQAEVGIADRTERGEVQFNEDNLSGICVFNLSLYTRPNDIITVDLLPDISNKELYDVLLKNKSLFSLQNADCLFTGILQKRIAQAVMKTAEIKDFSRPCTTLGDEELRRAANAAKSLRFTITGNAGFDRSQACRGGVQGNEIDPLTMQSRIDKNLYVCGEAIDLCGECGGYNLHFAFASGIIAGESL